MSPGTDQGRGTGTACVSVGQPSGSLPGLPASPHSRGGMCPRPRWWAKDTGQGCHRALSGSPTRGVGGTWQRALLRLETRAAAVSAAERKVGKTSPGRVQLPRGPQRWLLNERKEQFKSLQARAWGTGVHAARPPEGRLPTPLPALPSLPADPSLPGASISTSLPVCRSRSYF